MTTRTTRTTADEPAPPRARRRVGPRRSLAALALVCPVFAAPFAARALVDHGTPPIAHALAGGLERAFAYRTPAEPAFEPPSAPLDLDVPEIPGLDALRPPPPNAARDRGRRASSSELPPIEGGIHVRAELVARAAESGVIPSGEAVPASGRRPAGLALQGVSGFHAGLRDGDVLTRIGGAPATSVGVVVGVVTAALRRHEKVITGEVWRGEKRLAFAVDIPRPRGSRRAALQGEKSLP